MIKQNLYVWRSLPGGYDIGKIGAYASSIEEARNLIRHEWDLADRTKTTERFWLEEKLRQEPEIVESPEAFV